MSTSPFQLTYQENLNGSSDTCLMTVACQPNASQVIANHLEPLNAEARQFECWNISNNHKIERRHEGVIEYALCDGIAVGYTSFDHNDSLQQVTTDFYQTLFQVLKDCGNFHPLRIWHYLPQIDSLSPPIPYQTFCEARLNVIKESQQDISEGFCTATVVSNNANHGLFYFLASAEQGQPLENPRQLNAYDYPAQYVTAPPLFSRAIIHTRNDCIRLYISGTASIVGYQTLHSTNVVAQLDEIANNLEAIILMAGKENPVFKNKSLADLQGVKIYLKNPQDYSRIAEHLPLRFQNVKGTQIFKGQMCRQDLLLEIEGMIECRVK